MITSDICLGRDLLTIYRFLHILYKTFSGILHLILLLLDAGHLNVLPLPTRCIRPSLQFFLSHTYCFRSIIAEGQIYPAAILCHPFAFSFALLL